MYFAIRDDDTSFFTTPEELETAYSFLNSGCISLSVVPCTVPVHKDAVFHYGYDIPYREYSIADNQEIVSYLAANVAKGRYEILMHGYSHEYKRLDGKWMPELMWKDRERIFRELSEGKQLLEKSLRCSVSVLVAPNNRIGKEGIRACEEMKLDYSGIIKFNDRPLNGDYLKSFAKRYMFRLLFGDSYGGLLHYGKHNELFAYPIHDFTKALNHYEVCKRVGFPFVIFTHYHTLLTDQKEKENIVKLCNRVTDDGAELVGINELFQLLA